MKREDAQKLVFFVNSKDNMDALLHYMDIRASFYKEQLVRAQNIEDVRKFQGAIEELYRFKTLRDEVLNPGD